MKHIANNVLLNLISIFLVNFALIWLNNHYVLTVDFYHSSNESLLGLPGQDILTYATLQKWIYVTSAAYLLTKLVIVSILIYTALFLFHQETNFKSVFNIVVKAEYLFYVPAIIKLCWFQYEYPEGNLSDWHKVYILSALSVFDNVPADWSYALQSLNLFELAYWFLLAYGIQKVTNMSFDRSLKLVTVSYIPALFIWIATIAFCSIMISPGTA
jgi:hypothetical protein